MSKKTLLNETQVRRFMKLATLGTLSDGFVDGLSEHGYFTNEQEEELPGDEGPADEMDMEMGGEGEEELPMDDMAMDDEVGMDDELGDAAGESLPPEVVSQVEDALAQALGAMETALEEAIPELDLSVEQTDDEAEMGMDDEAEMGMDDMGDEMPMDDMGGDEMGEEPPEEGPALEDELVERIVRKVAARLRNRKGTK
jgi:hypothetical protein